MRLILFVGYFFGKMWKNIEKRPFFRVAMARLGKYHTGGYSRIGVYRVKGTSNCLAQFQILLKLTLKFSSSFFMIYGIYCQKLI